MFACPRFVSALLRVQQLRHSQDTNGGLGESGRGRQWSWGHKKREDEPLGMVHIVYSMMPCARSVLYYYDVCRKLMCCCCMCVKHVCVLLCVVL